MIELESRKLDVKFDGEVYKMNFPTVRKMVEHDKNVSEKNDSEKLGCVIDFFIDLGLKKEIAEELELYQVEVLMEALSKPKK